MSNYRRRMMQKQEDEVIDISLQDIYGNPINRSTANCYVVRETGQYKFPLVFGNAIKNGKVNTAAFTNNGGANSHDFETLMGAIKSPYIYDVWGDDFSNEWWVSIENSDADDAIADVTVVVDGQNSSIKFNVNSIPTTGANYIITAHNSDVPIWSWHIWLWPHDLSPVEITNSTGVKYNIMPVNLASKYDSDGVHIKNWFYQWGRPIPMLLPYAWNSSIDHTPGTIYRSNKADELWQGVSNPTEFYYNFSSPYNWFGDKSYYNLWDAACTSTGNSDNDTVKTVYDPCPVGWKVPNGNTFTGLSVLSSANGIVKMRRYSGDTVGVGFPMSGCRLNSNGSLYSVGSYGYVWLSSANSQGSAYNLLFDSSSVNPQDDYGRARGFSVRPVEDDLTKIDEL